MKNYVITIARGFGSGGKEIGNNLAKRLGISCYEKQILEFAAEQSGIAESAFSYSDEHLRKFRMKRFFEKIEPARQPFVSNELLFNIQADLIRQLARTESCIIVGKCADYILRDFDNVISVYIEAPRAACVASIMKKMGVSEEKAHQLITETDRYRAEYYKYYTGGNSWTNPINYDLTLNSDRVGRDRCIDLLEQYIKIRFGL